MQYVGKVHDWTHDHQVLEFCRPHIVRKKGLYIFLFGRFVLVIKWCMVL